MESTIILTSSKADVLKIEGVVMKGMSCSLLSILISKFALVLVNNVPVLSPFV